MNNVNLFCMNPDETIFFKTLVVMEMRESCLP